MINTLSIADFELGARLPDDWLGGRFRVMGETGEGILKRIRPSGFSELSPQMTASVLNSIAQVSIPGVEALVAHGVDEESIWCVAPECPGWQDDKFRQHVSTLCDLLGVRSGRLTQKETGFILQTLLDTLTGLHSHNLFLGSLPPSQILIDCEGGRIRPIISGSGWFGPAGLRFLEQASEWAKEVVVGLRMQAAAWEAFPSEDAARSFLGLRSHASPEVRRGDSACPASDIYSFGLLGYELLTGSLPPLNARGRLQVDLPIPLRSFFETLLDPDPVNRPACIDDVKHLFEAGFDQSQSKVRGSAYPKPAIRSRPERVMVESVRMEFALVTSAQVSENRQKPCTYGKTGQSAPSPFYLALHPVTRWQWSQMIGAPRKDQEKLEAFDARKPQTGVSWVEANEFCHILTEFGHRDGSLPHDCVYRLPREEEWEWAACGGSPLESDPPPGLEVASVVEVTNPWLGVGSGPVGQHLPNAIGLYDMGGNVWEWCEDVFFDADTTVGLRCKGEKLRVIRGGCWNSGSGKHMEKLQECYLEKESWSAIGFRVLRTV